MDMREDKAIPVVGVGASAGGLEAIREMLSTAGAENGLAFVVVQHLDPNHESLLAELLSRQSPMPVRQVKGGERVDSNHVYIIPPGHNLTIRNGSLELIDFEQPRGLRRPIDDFFTSLAHDQGGNAACVILSGTGADGTSGLRAIKEHGGLCVAQEPDSARYDGMPVSAIGTGLVDFVREPSEIVEALRAFFDRRQDDVDRKESAEIVAEHVDEMCSTIQDVIGHDFSGYKPSTLVRRIERRMQVLGIDKPSTYLQRIREDNDECEALFRDLLINVTRFFRDPEMFEELNRRVVRPLVEKAAPSSEIRIWVPGCSSGEEAYSLAVLFADALQGRTQRPLVQIFATDIDDAMLSIAREGVYPLASLGDIPERLRQNFTIGREGLFQMSPKVRDMIRFSNHSVVRDPPFSKLDLISCRNLLIYMGDKLQQMAFPLFHYSLKEDGYLFLGPSESIGRHEDLFSPMDQKSRIFQRRKGSARYPINMPPSLDSGRNRRRPSVSRRTEPNRAAWEESLSTRHLIDRYSPPSIVVDAEGALLRTNGRLAKYFEYPDMGPNASNAVSLARPGLREVLARLISTATGKKKRSVAKDVDVKAEFGSQTVDVIADPLPDSTVLVVFRDKGKFEAAQDDEVVELGPESGQMQLLEDELRLTRHRLRGTVEELETANEELKSSNEEMMSMNEELQSTNEELTTVNDELKSKVDQLMVANSDLRNFFESTQLAVVVLDNSLRIRSFTDAATDVFPLQSIDKGRALSDVSSRLDENEFLDYASSAIMKNDVVARTVSSHEGTRFWSLRVLPYRMSDGVIDGATIVLSEITEARQIQRDLDDERERLELAVKVAKIGVWEYQVDSGNTILDESELDLFGMDASNAGDIEAVMKRIDAEDRPQVEASLRRAITGESEFSASFRVHHPDGSIRHLRGLGRLVDGSSPARMIGVTFDVTSEAQLAEQREFLLSEMNHRVKNLFAIIAGFVTGSARQASSPEGLAKDIRTRIEALGRSHSLSQTHTGGMTVSLSDLVDAALSPYEANGNVVLAGPDVEVANSQLTPLSLILHEWATNSAKYGVLGGDEGNVGVSWELSGDEEVKLRWNEEFAGKRNGNGSSEAGFGTRLIRFSMKQLGGELEETEGDTGWSATITFNIARGSTTALQTPTY